MTSTVGFDSAGKASKKPPRKRVPQSAGEHAELEQNSAVNGDFIQLDNLQMVKGSDQYSEFFPTRDQANMYFLANVGQEWAQTSASAKMEA